MLAAPAAGDHLSHGGLLPYQLPVTVLASGTEYDLKLVDPDTRRYTDAPGQREGLTGMGVVLYRPGRAGALPIISKL